MISNAELVWIINSVEETSFDKAYVKGDQWKGYEVKNEGNGLLIAEMSVDTDALFLVNAREDIPRLVSEIQRLQSAIEYAISITNDDDTWDYLQNVLKGTEQNAHIFNIGGRRE